MELTERSGEEGRRAAGARAPAKINLFLLVGGRRPDGYHPVCSLMDKVTLFDRVDVRRTGRKGVRVTGVGIPAPENTVFRAAKALERETGAELDIEIVLDKQIPAAAGLAGGSSDAAAALRLLPGLCGLEVSEAAIRDIARSIGADVPFFLTPGPLVAEGAGELLNRPPTEIPRYHAVIVSPSVSLSTAEVYELYDSVSPALAASFPERKRAALARLAAVGGDTASLAGILQNDLEEPASSLCPDIPRIKEDLLSKGAIGALMSGSGSSVFGLFAGNKEAEAAYGELSGAYRDIWLVQPSR